MLRGRPFRRRRPLASGRHADLRGRAARAPRGGLARAAGRGLRAARAPRPPALGERGGAAGSRGARRGAAVPEVAAVDRPLSAPTSWSSCTASEVFEAIDRDPEAAFGALAGVSEARAAEAAEEWADRRAERRLYALLAPHGMARHVGEVIAIHGIARRRGDPRRPLLADGGRGDRLPQRRPPRSRLRDRPALTRAAAGGRGARPARGRVARAHAPADAAAGRGAAGSPRRRARGRHAQRVRRAWPSTGRSSTASGPSPPSAGSAATMAGMARSNAAWSNRRATPSSPT